MCFCGGKEMKLKNINWNKKLLVFFGDEVKNFCEDIKMNANSVKSFTDYFPEHTLYHPWEHMEHIEHITNLISRAGDRKFTVITNSSYILDHLTNLMKGARVNADEKYTRCKNKSAFIHKKDVGVYVCTGGKIKDAMPKKGEIIEWDNLSKVSEWLSDVYFEMG
jgi:hypothetical protein